MKSGTPIIEEVSTPIYLYCSKYRCDDTDIYSLESLALNLQKWIPFKNETSKKRMQTFWKGHYEKWDHEMGLQLGTSKGTIISSRAWLGLNSHHWQWPSWSGFMTWLSLTVVSRAGRCVCISAPVCQGLGKQMFLSVQGYWREMRRGRWRRKQLEFEVYIFT